MKFQDPRTWRFHGSSRGFHVGNPLFCWALFLSRLGPDDPLPEEDDESVEVCSALTWGFGIHQDVPSLKWRLAIDFSVISKWLAGKCYAAMHLSWVVPLPSNSDQEDYCIHYYWEGGTIQQLPTWAKKMVDSEHLRLELSHTLTWGWTYQYQVIQFVTFHSPKVGGHFTQPFQKVTCFHHPKKGQKLAELPNTKVFGANTKHLHQRSLT